jgi:hypothetical protein
MKLRELNFSIWRNLFAAALLLSLPFLCSEANARGGGRFGGGGFSGGSFRGGGEVAEGPRGGEVAEGPRGGVTAEGPRGNVAAGTAVRTLPDSAFATVLAGRRYYYDGYTYYEPCYDGTDVIYCVVPDPTQ